MTAENETSKPAVAAVPAVIVPTDPEIQPKNSRTIDSEAAVKKPGKLFRLAGLKMLLAFLTKPGFENTDYGTISRHTGITRTTVKQIISELEKSGYLIKHSHRKRFLIGQPELIERWAFHYNKELRIKLNPVRYRSIKFSGSWWEDIDIYQYHAVWGGEKGGAVLTEHLKPQKATVYADSTLPKFRAKYGLIRDECGEIEILKRIWRFGEFGRVAPPLVVYADLLATADERNLAAAQLIYDRYLVEIAKEKT